LKILCTVSIGTVPVFIDGEILVRNIFVMQTKHSGVTRLYIHIFSAEVEKTSSPVSKPASPAGKIGMTGFMRLNWEFSLGHIKKRVIAEKMFKIGNYYGS
jgi:hypothetical protein